MNTQDKIENILLAVIGISLLVSMVAVLFKYGINDFNFLIKYWWFFVGYSVLGIVCLLLRKRIY